MAETTFRFIYDSVAAATASDAGGTPSGKSETTQRNQKPVETGSPSRINNIMKQSTKSVQEGIKGGLKQLGIALSLGNLLKQSQVFTSSLNALFQLVGAFFDILLAPLMPYFAKWLRQGAPKLLEWAEKMAKWMENLFLEIGSADSFGMWVGEKVAEGLMTGIKKALGIKEDVPKDEQDTGLERVGKAVSNVFQNITPATYGMASAINMFANNDWDNSNINAPAGSGGGQPLTPIGGIGSGGGGILDTGMFSPDASMIDSTNELFELGGRAAKGAYNWMGEKFGQIGANFQPGNLGYGAQNTGGGMGGGNLWNPLGFLFGGNSDVANSKHDEERRAKQQKSWHMDNFDGGTWSD